MTWADEVRAEHKLDTMTHYLLEAFPARQMCRIAGTIA
jgi:hypothetical protein